MKLAQVVFVEAVRDLPTNQSLTAMQAGESPTRAAGFGYDLEATDGGVLATHPRSPGVRRMVPWSNVRWVDLAEELPALDEAVELTPEVAAQLPAVPTVKRRGRPPKAKAEPGPVPDEVA